MIFAKTRNLHFNKKEFPVDMDKIEFWKKETDAFLKLTEKICLERIDRLGFGNKISFLFGISFSNYNA
ncbi:MAG: hypothetical protein GQ574_24805 [Crocinitomix sp.]|nr:hypothetical protein [Crocinitomix sp.]